MLTNELNFFLKINALILVFYMFRTSYVHHQEEYIVHTALYGMFLTNLCKQSYQVDGYARYIKYI